jgi:hypothetical protein
VSWIVTMCRYPESGRGAWTAECLEPGCPWVVTEIRPEMAEAAGFEHTLTNHRENWPRPDGADLPDDNG